MSICINENRTKGLVHPAQYTQAAQVDEHAVGPLCPATEDGHILSVIRDCPLIPDMHRNQKPEMVKKKQDKHGRVRVATWLKEELMPQI